MKLVVARGGVRLDKLIADMTGCGRRRAGQWIRAGQVRIDGRPAAASAVPARGQTIEILESQPRPTAVPAEPVRILWQGGNVLAVAKPAGLHTQRGRSGGSVAEFLEQRFKGIAQVGKRPEEGGTVHRLDRDTSGVLLAATTAAEYARLRAMFSAGQAAKEYLALVAGTLEEEVSIDRPLAMRGSRVGPASRGERARKAWTRARPLDVGRGWSLVHVHMHTGVRHQVRVHLALCGHPLLGDPLYGGPVLPSARAGHLLHALRIRIDEEIDVTAPAPADFVSVYAALKTGIERV
ncbi:MAG TPA: RluA family pseudouridine synthase [Candidatus Limnocylindrales bacterium]|nr:RluA family pseudouridine synthase [Candidatus Limnocylindrales bacterium]